MCNALHIRQEDEEEPQNDLKVKEYTDGNPGDIEKGGAETDDNYG